MSLDSSILLFVLLEFLVLWTSLSQWHFSRSLKLPRIARNAGRILYLHSSSSSRKRRRQSRPVRASLSPVQLFLTGASFWREGREVNEGFLNRNRAGQAHRDALLGGSSRIGSHSCPERIGDQITTLAQRPSRAESSQKMHLNAAQVQSTSEFLTWPPLPPTLPPPTLSSLPSPPAASSCVSLQLCLALQGSCSSPTVHSHQRVCFCAGVRPGRTRAAAISRRVVSAAASRWESRPGEDFSSARLSRADASQAPRPFNSFLRHLAVGQGFSLLRAVGRRRGTMLLSGLLDAYVVLQVSVWDPVNRYLLLKLVQKRPIFIP